MASNKELMKTIEILAESLKSIQDKLVELKCKAMHNGVNPQSSFGTQQSGTDIVASNEPPPSKRSRIDDGNSPKNNEPEDCEDTHSPLALLSEAVSAFLEVAFRAMLEYKVRVVKAKAHPTPGGSDVPKLT